MLAGATLSVVQAAHTRWFLHGGDLATTMSESLARSRGGAITDPGHWVTADADRVTPDPRSMTDRSEQNRYP